MEALGRIGELPGTRYTLHNAVFDVISNAIFRIRHPKGLHGMSTNIQIRMAAPDEASIIGELIYKMECEIWSDQADSLHIHPSNPKFGIKVMIWRSYTS